MSSSFPDRYLEDENGFLVKVPGIFFSGDAVVGEHRKCDKIRSSPNTWRTGWNALQYTDADFEIDCFSERDLNTASGGVESGKALCSKRLHSQRHSVYPVLLERD